MMFTDSFKALVEAIIRELPDLEDPQDIAYRLLGALVEQGFEIVEIRRPR
jgi:hypothetical protein